MNIENGVCLTLQLDIDSAEPPNPGSFEHAVLVGKLAFFTALGIPDNDIFHPIAISFHGISAASNR